MAELPKNDGCVHSIAHPALIRSLDGHLSFTPFASPTRELAIAETSNLTVCSTYIARTSYIYLNLY
jgi:hypothetical protein